ncbi:succinyl-CoA synthetase subunit beta [Tepiditoga spiralis]|uniref:Succinyl-CoA synthetase subunit beta n=1 Tax=Tepiditoga spiralis TaxID=2108365 RepID=A0A7G1G6Q8_9BACT|nr:ATP-grasp domain-containing protein [Tepiditoga spiralis]BBE30533.1 succinyl-CoA synthetase subunit beta [Tepiditoga spiralis]
MKIHEFVGKEILSKNGIKVPKSFLTREKEVQCNILPCVLKSQVLVGGRMKAGGILFSDECNDFKKKLSLLLEKKIKGEKPYGVLIEEKKEIKKEYYLSLILDRTQKDIIIGFSKDGGIDIEDSESLITGNFESIIDKLPVKIKNILPKLRKIFREKDLTLLEINPLAELKDGSICALDAVFHLDDNAIYRQKWAQEFEEETQYPFHYVKLNGDTGIIGCGAGIVMATMDTVKMYGGTPANFLDLGGGANEENTIMALELLKNEGIKKIVMNIFGGITECDVIANAIVNFTKKNKDIKLFIRLTGTNEKKAKKILIENNIPFYEDMYSMIKEGERV